MYWKYYVLVYENGEMRPFKTISDIWERIKENCRVGEFTMIYCQNFCKCHNIPPYNNNMIIFKGINI
jgi:hypothetical protein